MCHKYPLLNEETIFHNGGQKINIDGRVSHSFMVHSSLKFESTFIITFSII